MNTENKNGYNEQKRNDSAIYPDAENAINSNLFFGSESLNNRIRHKQINDDFAFMNSFFFFLFFSSSRNFFVLSTEGKIQNAQLTLNYFDYILNL